MIPAKGVRKWHSQTAFMQRGTSPLEMWYAGFQNQIATATQSTSVDVIRLQPFVISRQVVLDRIAFELTTAGGAGSKGRVGIYASTSIENLYPANLLVDGGEFALDGATGVKSSTISLTLGAGVYWFASLFGVAAPTLRTPVAGSYGHILGAPSTIGAPNLRAQVSLAYTSLPATLPGGGITATSATTPLIGVRCS